MECTTDCFKAHVEEPVVRLLRVGGAAGYKYRTGNIGSDMMNLRSAWIGCVLRRNITHDGFEWRRSAFARPVCSLAKLGIALQYSYSKTCVLGLQAIVFSNSISSEIILTLTLYV